MGNRAPLRLNNGTIELVLDPVSLRGTVRLLANGDAWTLDILRTAGWLADAPAPNHGYHTPRVVEAPTLERLPVPEVADLCYDEIRLLFARCARACATLSLSPRCTGASGSTRCWITASWTSVARCSRPPSVPARVSRSM
jgi:hypothetical protein